MSGVFNIYGEHYRLLEERREDPSVPISATEADSSLDVDAHCLLKLFDAHDLESDGPNEGTGISREIEACGLKVEERMSGEIRWRYFELLAAASPKEEKSEL